MNPALAALVSGARHLVALTGAGVSTLSGLPDFRGKKGLYSDPEAWRIFDLDTFLNDQTVYYRGARSLLYGDHDLSSSLIHHTLAQWQTQGWLKALITQNVDRLHQKAGSTGVIEVHGSPEVHHCLTCGTPFPYQTVADRVRGGDIPPRCSCGGPIKPDITFFGEALPEAAFARARQESARADVLLVLGSSLTVYPAASLPELCLRNGGKVVIVNEQPTSLDSRAFLVLRDLEEAFSPPV